MSTLFASLLPCIPLPLAAVAIAAATEPGLRPRRTLRASGLATLFCFAAALLLVGLVASQGPVTSPIIGLDGLGLSVRLDALSVAMFLLVTFIGVIVVQFSRNYMDGDPRQGVFISRLCLTLAAVCFLVLAGNLVHLVAAWIATSLALHRLLLFYSERRRAVIAARKKFITARIGDACLLAAAVLIARRFHTTDIATILDVARHSSAVTSGPAVVAATYLIAVAALLKSAQFPTHGWLPEVMETPTPVSALLHAGIINAGGFLVIRFADVMLLNQSSLHLLALIGGFTALFGGLVMLTQPSVKVSLAWSTVGQMGFMMLECGFGAFPIAVLHIVAHSLYKAHAFLSSGSVIDIARSAWQPDPSARPQYSGVLVSLVLALGLYGSIGWGLTGFREESAAAMTLGAILVMGLTLLTSQTIGGHATPKALVRTTAAAAGATVSYFLLQACAIRLLSPALPSVPKPDGPGLVLMGLAVVSFALVTLMQILAPRWIGLAAWQSLRVHLANGFYANALFDRLAGAMKRPAPTQS